MCNLFLFYIFYVTPAYSCKTSLLSFTDYFMFCIILFNFIFVYFSSHGGKKSGGHGRGKCGVPQGQSTGCGRSGGHQQVPEQDTSR